MQEPIASRMGKGDLSGSSHLRFVFGVFFSFLLGFLRGFLFLAFLRFCIFFVVFDAFCVLLVLFFGGSFGGSGSFCLGLKGFFFQTCSFCDCLCCILLLISRGGSGFSLWLSVSFPRLRAPVLLVIF